MDYIWILVAFLCGYIVKQVGLPPLVGYLLAGFGLHAAGFEAHSSLEYLADLGITLMLFTIGLKLNFKSLAKPEIFVVANMHCLIWCSLVLGKLLLMGAIVGSSITFFDATWQVALLIAFALSFSSTVGVIKLLEEQDELKTRHGKIAMGILVIQDILAVVFLAIANGAVPSLWAPLLVLLIPLRPMINRLMKNTGHGELLPLTGIFLALTGYQLFYLVGLKGDLGALLIGMLIAGYPKSTELYKSLISFKDLFLIGFFLSIGFTALPTMEMVFAALSISVLLVLKFILFFALFLALKLRARNAFLSAMTLSNFSEFGLIVANMAVSREWLSPEWLVIIALAVTVSFIISGAIFKYSHQIYARYQPRINRFQWQEDVSNYQLTQPDDAEILVIGLGRVGTATYDSLSRTYPKRVWGIDADEERVKTHIEEGRQVTLADGDDAEFWSKLKLNSISLIMLSTPNVSEMQSMIAQIRQGQFGGRIVCIARFEDERQELIASGADAAFSYYAEVGSGFAEEGKRLLQHPA